VLDLLNLAFEIDLVRLLPLGLLDSLPGEEQNWKQGH